jgi:hypothetical protein
VEACSELRAVRREVERGNLMRLWEKGSVSERSAVECGEEKDWERTRCKFARCISAYSVFGSRSFVCGMPRLGQATL